MGDGLKPKLIPSLRREHIELLRGMNRLQEHLYQLRAGREISEAHQKFFRKLSVLEDKIIRHMQREEQYLYTALQLHVDGELVNLMMEEHRRVTDTIEKSRPTPSGNVKIVTHPFSKWKSELNKTLSFKKEHLRKEEGVVFWLAEVKMRISEDQDISSIS